MNPKFFCLILSLFFCRCSLGMEEVTIDRDEFGTPHIFAETLEGVSFGSGYAQAEDRLEELLRNYRKAEGTMAEAFGPNWIQHDYRQRLWQHAPIARERYKTLSPRIRNAFAAYQEGIKLYMRLNPKQVPAWAPELRPWQIVALTRFIIWNWPEGEAGGKLQRAGIQPDPIGYRGSNEWVVGPRRTALGAPIALIDPHLSWYGEVRFYEMRQYCKEMAVSGVGILGTPFISLGHSRYASVAMTTGGPDTSDVYEIELNPENPRQYRYDNAWRDMAVKTETIRIKTDQGMEEKKVEIEYTHHGPVVAHQKGKAYAPALPYFYEVGLADQMYKMFTAKNLDEMKAALSLRQLMSQNVMVATIQGDIFYVRNGRVPIRPLGVDPKRPIPGNTSKTEWLGIHPFADLVQITNPTQGYMQNCNASPYNMMKDSPLVPENYAEHPYLYNDNKSAPHQRAAMVLNLLHSHDRLTPAQAMDIALSPDVFKAETWQKRIQKAWEAATAAARTADASALVERILRWNRRSDADSVEATAFLMFKIHLGGDSRLLEPPESLTDPRILDALDKAAKRLHEEYGTLDVAYGSRFRVGRQGSEKTYPVAGGSVQDAGMATPRAISFEKKEKLYVGHSGQTSTQLVLLSDPPQSFTVLPLGESDHPESGHWDDQAEKLFSKSKMKPTYFLNKEELQKHVSQVTILQR